MPATQASAPLRRAGRSRTRETTPHVLEIVAIVVRTGESSRAELAEPSLDSGSARNPTAADQARAGDAPGPTRAHHGALRGGYRPNNVDELVVGRGDLREDLAQVRGERDGERA